jgi:hypothetical protein
LPEGFGLWELADRDGLTVAHCVVIGGGDLPESFDRWKMPDRYGLTVADYVPLSRNTMPVTFYALGHSASYFGLRGSLRCVGFPQDQVPRIYHRWVRVEDDEDE